MSSYGHVAGAPFEPTDGVVIDIDGETWTYTDEDGWTCPDYAQPVTLAHDIEQYDFDVVTKFTGTATNILGDSESYTFDSREEAERWAREVDDPDNGIVSTSVKPFDEEDAA